MMRDGGGSWAARAGYQLWICSPGPGMEGVVHEQGLLKLWHKGEEDSLSDRQSITQGLPPLHS